MHEAILEGGKRLRCTRRETAAEAQVLASRGATSLFSEVN